MAHRNPPRRRVFRRTVVFTLVIAVSLAGLALERTATGATTGKPSHAKLTTKYHYNPRHKYEPPKHDHRPPYHKPPHYGTTTTTSATTTSTTTTSTLPPTTTTMKHHKPPHCDKIFVWCFDKHHHKVLIVKFHCRPPSGGHNPGTW